MSCPTAEKFKQHEIIPDVLKKLPQQVLEVRHGAHKLDFGNHLTPTQVKDPPTQIHWQADPNSFYTLLFLDIDVPSRQDPQYREVEHWLVVNIPGNQVEKGDTLAEFISSGPPQGTGFHRYLYLVYKQPGKIHDQEHAFISKRSVNGRAGFKTETFATKHRLEGPIAANFYQAEYDDYVPTVHAQFSA